MAIHLNILFVQQCTGNVSNYELVVEDTLRLAQSPEPTNRTISIIVNLVKNAYYRFYLVRTNEFGSSESTRINICEPLSTSNNG